MKAETIQVASPAGRDWAVLHIVAAPLAFLIMLILPVSSMTYPIRCSLGLLVWTAWWWIARPVNLAVTGLLPLAVTAAFNFVPMSDVLPAYADEVIILLMAANILTAVWQKWGLDRRIALASLLGVGTSTRRQILAWYSICVVLSAFLPRTIVAATMVPIVIAMLRYIGIDDLWNSKFGTALLLAMAWGAGVGGFLTPLGGAPNLLAMKLVQDQVTRHEFLFVTWLAHNAPLTIAVVLVVFVYIRFALKPEITETPGTRSYFKQELKKLGPITVHEKWGLGVFLLFKNLGMNPIPYVYIIAAASHCGFMLPSSAGSSAIAAGYGVNLRTMFVKGFWVAAISFLIIAVGAYLLMEFWPGFGYA